MAASYAKSTYAEILDDVRLDIAEDGKVAAWQSEMWIQWILRAEERICSLVDVKEEYVLRVTTQVDEYGFQDRPVVTGASNATPIVITSAGHGLTTGDVIYIVGVEGNTAANGRFQVTVLTSSTFQIKNYIRLTDATNASPIVITAKGHPFQTVLVPNGGAITVAGVLGNTAANGIWATYTKIDANTFSLTGSTGNGAYTGGGTVVMSAIGSGTYTSGGRYWREDEVPTYFRDFRLGTRVQSGRSYTIDPATIDEIRRWKELDGPAVYSSLEAPYAMAVAVKDMKKYLRFFPVPQATEDVTLTGWLKIVPRDYYGTEVEGAFLHLPGEYDQLVKAYVKARAYERLKMPEMSAHYENEHNRLIKEFRVNQYPRSVETRVVYA